MIKLFDHLLFLCNVGMLKLDYILLDLLTDICQNNVVMTLVFVSTKSAVESLINLAAILNLCILVVFAEKAFRIIGESLNFIKNFLITLNFFGSRTKFLESVHRIIIWVIS